MTDATLFLWGVNYAVLGWIALRIYGCPYHCEKNNKPTEEVKNG